MFLISLGRKHYRRHREIYDWLVKNTIGKKHYAVLFGYQEIELSGDEKDRFLKWLDPKNIRREISIVSHKREV